jgi:phasin family protein
MASVKSETSKAAKAMDDVAASYEEAASGAGGAIKDNVERAMGAAAEFSAFGKGNMEAWMAATAATQKGVQEISARAAAYSKHALENHVAAAKSMMTSKSVQEVVEKQTEYAKSAFEEYVSELNKMSELMTGFAKEAMRPFNERVSAVSTIMQNGRLR